MAETRPIDRIYYMDWLRGIAVILLVPFHAAMIYVPWPYHLKSDTNHIAFEVFGRFLGLWHMPLLFMLSGAGTWFALGFRSGRQYAWERVLRLFVPVVFGMLVVVPPQHYVERLQEHAYIGQAETMPPGIMPGDDPAYLETYGFDGNYLEFQPHIFNGFYPYGNLSWSHLWFMIYLFIFSLALLPIFLRYRHGAWKERIPALAAWFARPWHILLPCVPFMITDPLLRPVFPGLQTFVTDWANVLLYGGLFFYGFLFCADGRFIETMARYRRRHLALGATGVGVMTVYLLFFLSPGYNPGYMAYRAVAMFTMWCWVLTLFGYGKVYLNFTNAALRYFTPAVLPFYILHQTVLLILGHYLLPLHLNMWLEYLLLCVLTLVLSLAVYDLFIKRTPVTRFLFGMKVRGKKKPGEPKQV